LRCDEPFEAPPKYSLGTTMHAAGRNRQPKANLNQPAGAGDES